MGLIVFSFDYDTFFIRFLRGKKGIDSFFI